MIKQYKLINYHFQLIAFIVVLNIIGILLIYFFRAAPAGYGGI